MEIGRRIPASIHAAKPQEKEVERLNPIKIFPKEFYKQVFFPFGERQRDKAFLGTRVKLEPYTLRFPTNLFPPSSFISPNWRGNSGKVQHLRIRESFASFTAAERRGGGAHIINFCTSGRWGRSVYNRDSRIPVAVAFKAEI